ncbi:MAG TPA: glycosyltransferase family 2 protein [Gaiellaceae bacterium]|nr:glycosyltransferase family 2 protein [Gaiellaceae bacterium]
MLLKGIFWGSLGAIVWTHAGYPLAAAGLARVRPRPVRKDDITPEVTVIVPAHDEAAVIEQKLENLLALDYPADRFSVLVASDASTDGMDELVSAAAEKEPRIRLLACPRGGKLAAMNRAVPETNAEIVAFTDANAAWEPDALRKLVRNFADPDVGYVCGQLRLQVAGGSNREGLYWRYEMWLRRSESAIGSVTGGNGSIYAVRRSDYVTHRFGHDLGLPDAMVKRGRRAVYEPEALAFEQPPPELEDEYGRKVRMFPWAWQHLVEGRMLSGVTPLYLAELLSHRVLRYGTGVLHVALFVSSLVLARQGGVYAVAFAAQLAWLGLAAAGRLRLPVPLAGLAYYYALVTWATLVSLVRYLRHGVPPVWEKAAGTR